MPLSFRPIHTAFVALLASLVLCAPALAEKGTPLIIHEEARALAMPDYADETLAPVKFAPQDSKLTIVHFWATWCVPCLEELPILDQFVAKHKDSPVAFIPLALDGKNVAKVRAFYDDNGIKHMPLYMDASMKSFRATKASGLPTTLFFDQDGKEVARAEGPADWESNAISRFVSGFLPTQ